MAPRKRLGPARIVDGARRGRGLAKATKKWGKEKLNVIFNEYGQPCGGEYDKLASQLGYFVKNGENFPLDVEWTGIPSTILQHIWKDVQDNTNAPPEYEKVCIAALNKQWKDWKHSVKDTYNRYKTDEERLAILPLGVTSDQWAKLVRQWGTEKSKEISEINKINRSKQDCLSRTGKKSHCIVRKEMEDQGKPIDRMSVYIVTRTNKSGQPVDLTTSRMIQTLTDAIEELPEEDQSSPSKREKIFTNILGKDGHGRMRCMGLGLTKSMVFGKASTSETVSTVRAEFEEKLECQRAEFLRREEAQEAKYAMRFEAQEKAFEAFQQKVMQLQGKDMH